MTYDFKSSLMKGLERGAVAARNNNVIDKVVDDFAHQIFEGMGESVVICRAVLYDIGGYVTYELDEPSDNAPSFEAIVARSSGWEDDQVSHQAILAELARGELGFPCTVICDEYEFQCDDPEALQEALAEMVSLPSTGKVLNDFRAGNAAAGPSRRPL